MRSRLCNYEIIAFGAIQSLLLFIYCLLIYIYVKFHTILKLPLWCIQILLIYLLWLCIYHIFLHKSNPGYFYAGSFQKNKTQIHYCKICCQEKPNYVHHCSRCNRCIIEMDHHCVFLMNCIGYQNRKPFLGFLLFSCVASYVGSCLAFYSSLQFIQYYGFDSVESWSFSLLGWGLFALFVNILLFFLEQCILLSFHMTYLDYLKGDNHFKNIPLQKRFRWNSIQSYFSINTPSSSWCFPV